MKTKLNYFVKSKIIFCAFCFSSFLSLAHAGVIVNGTRFIYPESQANGIVLKISNMDPYDYLIQSKILAANGSELKTIKNAHFNPDNVPFIVTPPLFNLGARKENSLKIIYASNALPKDRESLFSITIAAIPSGQPQRNSLQVAIRSHFKLFFRPTNLDGNVEQAYQKLLWEKNSKNLRITNPTPFFVTLFDLSVNGKNLNNAGMIPPYSSLTRSWCPKSGECRIRWKSLNDYGAVLPEWSVSPSAHPNLGTSNAVN